MLSRVSPLGQVDGAAWDEPFHERVNNDGLTPLTFAAALGRLRMFQMILKTHTITLWDYGPYTCKLLPMLRMEQPVLYEADGVFKRREEKTALECICAGAPCPCHAHALPSGPAFTPAPTCALTPASTPAVAQILATTKRGCGWSPLLPSPPLLPTLNWLGVQKHCSGGTSSLHSRAGQRRC